MQVTARMQGVPLNAMTVDTHVTTMTEEQQVNEYPDNGDGAFVHGIFVQGARWEQPVEEEEEEIGGVACKGSLADASLKELLPPMPVIYVRAVKVEPAWEPTAVGYLRHDEAIFECPVYHTSSRGHTFVFLATLVVGAKSTADKWVLAGVALLLQTDD